MKITLTFLLLFFTTITFGQINFEKDTNWKAVLAEAKAANKLVFVDVYTDWCGPCKVMDADVFSIPQIGTVYNSSFINYKINAEKLEGPSVAKKYLVSSYPTYLFVNGDGTLIYRSNGSMQPSEFLQVAKNAKIEMTQEMTILKLDELYPSHKTDKDFLFKYLTRLTALKLPTAELLDQYEAMLSPQEQADVSNIKVIAANCTWLNKKIPLGYSFDVLTKNSAVVRDLQDKKLLNQSLDDMQTNAMDVSLKQAIDTKNVALFEKVKHLKKDYNADAFDNKQTLSLQYYLGTKNIVAYKASAKNFINSFLLKIPADTLAKWDDVMYQDEKHYFEKQNDPNYNNADYLNTYRHTQTIQLSNLLHDVAKQMMAMPLSFADMQDLKKWTAYTVNIAASDTAYYKKVYPGYRKTNAMVLYKTGQKQLATEQMQALIAENAKNKQVQQSLAAEMQKMRAGK